MELSDTKLDEFLLACEPERLLLGEDVWFRSLFEGKWITVQALGKPQPMALLCYSSVVETLYFTPIGPPHSIYRCLHVSPEELQAVIDAAIKRNQSHLDASNLL